MNKKWISHVIACHHSQQPLIFALGFRHSNLYWRGNAPYVLLRKAGLSVDIQKEKLLFTKTLYFVFFLHFTRTCLSHGCSSDKVNKTSSYVTLPRSFSLLTTEHKNTNTNSVIKFTKGAGFQAFAAVWSKSSPFSVAVQRKLLFTDVSGQHICSTFKCQGSPWTSWYLK